MVHRNDRSRVDHSIAFLLLHYRNAKNYATDLFLPFGDIQHFTNAVEFEP
jgi:hypothetical protein